MNDALKAAAIVAALWIVATLAHNLGFAAGLRAAPDHIRAIERRASADDEAWARILDAVAADGTCRQIRDLVLQDETASEEFVEPSSPHNP